MLNVGLWRDLAKKELQVPRWHAGTRKVGGVDSCETTIFRCHIRISGGHFKMMQNNNLRNGLPMKNGEWFGRFWCPSLTTTPHCWNVHILCTKILPQEWCKFDLEWALFKERFEVADKSLSDSKPQGSVF
jgi:hypothetical protein